ncbi:hypothetical protein FSST1_000234 [Fusarium sambucinum]
MRVAAHIAALALFFVHVSSKADIPFHMRSVRHASNNGVSYLGMISRRDECSDVFGANSHNAACAPSNTLCCTRESQSYPSCEKHLGKGWCCVEEDGNCYVDQESVCDEDNSVPCTTLMSGESEACCPKLTSCASGFEASKDNVRCNINRKDLLNAVKASEEETMTTSPTSQVSTELKANMDDATTTTDDVKTTEPLSQTEEPSSSSFTTSSSHSSSSSLSNGAIAGIAVGAAAVGIAIASLAFWFLKRKKIVKEEVSIQQTNADYYHTQQEQQQQKQPQQNWPHELGS